ncbi:MAG: DUF6188 family protein [Gaiellales bacterium]
MSELAFLAGRTVAEIRIGSDGDTRIVFEPGSNEEPSLYADLGWCVYEGDGGSPRPLRTMTGSVVRSASVAAGVLAISFTDGAIATCRPDAAVEAWQVVGGRLGHLIVCMPGGEVAVFASRDAGA